MKHEEKLNWGIYWVGIAFILTCLSLAVTAEGQADPCQWEIDNAKSVTRCSCAAARQLALTIRLRGSPSGASRSASLTH
jgi:hypothetical protein